MRPRQGEVEDPQGDLFRSELRNVISLQHPLVRLADSIDWDRFEEAFGVTYDDETGRPAISTRLMVALHYLKYAFDLSNEQVVARWVENPFGSTSRA